MTSLSRKADVAIDAANILCKTGATADSCDICGASDTPIGVSARVCRSGELATLFGLTDDVFRLTASGSIAFGATVELANGGKVATHSAGTIIGRALQAAASGEVLDVAVETATLIGAGGGAVTASAVSGAIGDFDATQQAESQIGLFGALTGQAAKVLRVKSDESGFEYSTPAGAETAEAKADSVATYSPKLVAFTGDGAAITTFASESSTFSGWGNTYTAPVPAFNRVRVYCRYWDGTDPVTTIHIQVRQTDRSGTVLATGSASWTAAEDTIGYADVDLDTTVNEAGNVFIAYWGNGKMGYPTAVAKTGRLVNVTSSLAYTTAKSGTPTWSASGNNTYVCGFNLYTTTQYSPSAMSTDFASLVETKTVSTIITNKWRGIVLPATVYALEGRETNIWYRNIHDSDFLDSELEWVVTVGTENNRMVRKTRCWRYTPSAADAGTTTLSVAAYHRGSLLETKSCSLVTKALTAGNGVTRKVWTMGDSTADDGVPELINLFNYNKNSPTAGGGADVMTIDHSKGHTAASGNDAEGNSRSFHHDGNSGFSTLTYATGVTQFGTGMNNVAGWLAADGVGMASGDWMIIHLGLNGSLSAATNVTHMTTILTALRAGLPSGVRYLLLPTYGPAYSDTASGAIYYSKDNMCQRAWRIALMALRRALLAEFEDDSDITICGAWHNLDTETNYSPTTAAISARNSNTETVQTDLIHPGASGYYQVMDSIKCALKCQET